MSLRVVYGHHKCATGWITTIVREIGFHLGLHHEIVHLPKHYDAYGTLGDFARATGADLLFYTNAEAEPAATLPAHRGLHVVRDPRDILVSAYFSHLHSHPTNDWPELEPHREALQAASKEEGLFLEMDFSRAQFEAMAAWDYDQDHVLELHMETLTADPMAGFTKMATFFGWLDGPSVSTAPFRQVQLAMNRLNQRGRRFMPGELPLFPVPRRRLRSMPSRTLARILERKSFNRLAGGRTKGQENVKSHYRKGVPGDWKNHFTPAHKHAFKLRHGDLLIRLGYEEEMDW